MLYDFDNFCLKLVVFLGAGPLSLGLPKYNFVGNRPPPKKKHTSIFAAL